VFGVFWLAILREKLAHVKLLESYFKLYEMTTKSMAKLVQNYSMQVLGPQEI
jgi:hypothetical protein